MEKNNVISEAFAQTAAPVAGGSGMMDIVFMVGLIAIMWFLLIRPQNKRMKEHQEVVTGLKRGDNVVTESGICGTITKILDDSYVELEIAEGTTVKYVRNAVSVVLEAEKPAKKEKSPKTKKK